MEFTQQDVESLGDKLDAMHLTEGERAALVAVFDSAAPDSGDEVAGYAYDLNPKDLSFKQWAGKAFSASGTGNVRSGGLYEEINIKP